MQIPYLVSVLGYLLRSEKKVGYENRAFFTSYQSAWWEKSMYRHRKGHALILIFGQNELLNFVIGRVGLFQPLLPAVIKT